MPGLWPKGQMGLMCIEDWETEFSLHADVEDPRGEMVGRFILAECDEWIGNLRQEYAWE